MNSTSSSRAKAFISVTAFAITAALAIPTSAGASVGLSGAVPNTSFNSLSSGLDQSAAPTDLVALAATQKRSVVAISCAKTSGTGFSASVDTAGGLRAAGMKSYIITNYSIVKSCLGSKSVDVTNSAKVTTKGTIWSWDQTNDLAAVATSTLIPPLEISGSDPSKGQWVGAMQIHPSGSAALSTGIISSVTPKQGIATTTAALLAKASSGPVFDRKGLVVGVIWQKYADSEGFGILHTAKSICSTLVRCVENTSLPINSIASAAKDLIIEAKTSLSLLQSSVSSTLASNPKLAPKLTKLLKSLPAAPKLEKSTDPVSDAVAFSLAVTDSWKLYQGTV